MGPATRASAAVLATIVVTTVVVLPATAGAAEATTTPTSVTLPVRDTDWTDTVTLPRFDPGLGELRAVNLTVQADMEGTIAVENLADTTATLQARAAAAVTVSRPAPTGGTLDSVSPGVTRTDDLAPYDGDLDHGGVSGATNAVSDTLTSGVTLTDPADLLLFTGLSPITLPTTGTDASVPPPGPDVDAQLTTRVGAVVTVSYTYVSDTRPPDPPTILSSPSAFTPDPDPLITFSAEPGATTECELTTPVGTDTWTPCTSPWQGDLAASGDGAYTFAVRATDGAGNVGEPATRTFTLDRIAPVPPTLSFMLIGPDPLLGRWVFAIEPGATARCSFDGSPPAPCTSPHTQDLGPLPDGDHTLTVVAVDAAGNTSAPASSTYTLDRVAPEPPTITLEPPTPDNDPTPTWTFDLATDAVTATCSVDGATPTACSSPFTVNLAAAGEGLHTLAIRNADAAGNASSPATGGYVLDRGPPGAPTVTGPGSPGNDPTPTWTISTEAGATTECRLDDGGWSPCDGSFTTSFGPGSDGVHILSVRATDAAGNVGPAAVSIYSLDTTPPAAPSFATVPADPSNNATPVWTFTVEPWSAATCSLDGGPWVPCSSPHQADLLAEPDGWHTLAVRATDPQGNTGPAASGGFTLDRTAPTAPTIMDAPASPGPGASVIFEFTTPAGTTTSCRLDGGGPFSCSGQVATTFADDGDHRFEVVAVDSAGNRSGSAVALYTLDRIAPVAPSITDTPVSPSRLTSPQWTFTIEDASSGECSLDGGPWTPCASSFSADLSTAADGPHTFAVRSTDAAGNVGTEATGTFALDRTPPGAPVVTSAPDPQTADDKPSWTFTVEAGATAECRLDDGPWVPCDGSFTDDLSGAPDGTHSLEIRAVDAVGNEGPTTVTAFELDRAAAAPASFTATPVSPGNDPDPEWTFTYEPGTTAWCSLDGSVAVACDGAFAVAVVEDGTHGLTIVVVDGAGNVSEPATTVYELDTMAPGAPKVTAPRSPDRDDSPEWLIVLEPGAVAECSFDGAEAVGCGNVFTTNLVGLEGSHQLLVVARDAAGNASVPTLTTYVLDTVAPAAPVILHTPDRAAWTWRFSIEPAATAECSVDGVPWTVCASPLPGGPPDETVRFEVRAVDRAGNRSPVTSTTVTPTRGSVVSPPPPPVPPAPPPEPGRTTDPPRPFAGTEPQADPGLPASPPGRSLQPLNADADMDARTIGPPMRDQGGLLTGPVRDLLQAAAESTTIPVLVVILVLAFVAVQNRIDRMDPKLADAPVRHEPEYVEFE